LVANEQENDRFYKTIENFQSFFHDYEILFVILCPNIGNSKEWQQTGEILKGISLW
jgi:hypothetical protein